MEKRLYWHENADLKIPPGTPGCNVLPDGTVALSAALLRQITERNPDEDTK